MKTIVIIENDDDLGPLMAKMLENDEHGVTLFKNAEQFLPVITNIADLYIVDVNLGGLTGDKVCELLKTNSATQHKPILLISAHPELNIIASRAGATDFLQKPFSRKILIQNVLELLSNYK